MTVKTTDLQGVSKAVVKVAPVLLLSALLVAFTACEFSNFSLFSSNFRENIYVESFNREILVENFPNLHKILKKFRDPAVWIVLLHVSLSLLKKKSVKYHEHDPKICCLCKPPIRLEDT